MNAMACSSASRRRARARRAASYGGAFRCARAEHLGLGDRRSASLIWMGTFSRNGSKTSIVFSNDGTLLWPVREGLFGRGFGSGEGGYHMAIDIDGAARFGRAGGGFGHGRYAGHELRGYGNLIMIMHAGGWVTLYGHNQRLLVVPGEHVVRGQAIAELGSTGRSMGPHVHFELVHDGLNCDPLPLFRYESANAPERSPQAALATWLPEGPRPKSVRCTSAARTRCTTIRSGNHARRRQLGAPRARRVCAERRGKSCRAGGPDCRDEQGRDPG